MVGLSGISSHSSTALRSLRDSKKFAKSPPIEWQFYESFHQLCLEKEVKHLIQKQVY